ncbi:MAG TPA: hypothetical protein VFU36_13935 [Jatrophihabitans sp.]|nr:hypothetical protein [Jatrophihabitans sp.]
MSSELTVARPEPAVAVARRSEWWLLDRLALAVAVLSGAVLYALIGRGGWYVDDFLNFGLAKQSPLGRRYLDLPVFGHPQPAVRLLNWLLYRIAPMNYHLAAAVVCLGLAVAVWMIYRILRLAFRPSPWHLVLTAVAGFTGLWVPVAAWWAGGSEISGCVLANVLMTHAVLRCYLGRQRPLWAVLAAGWLLAGLCFYERALLGGVFAAWFVLAVAARSARPRELLRVLRRVWPSYLTLLIAMLGYLDYYLTHSLVRRQPGYTHSEVLRFLWVCWSHSLIPAMFGGTLRTGQNIAESYADPPLWWLVVCQLGWLALVGYGLLRNRLRAALAWLVFIALFLPAQYTIATARLHVHGPGIGNEFRYLADLFPLLVLTVALSVSRPSARMLAAAGADDRQARRLTETEPADGPVPAGSVAADSVAADSVPAGSVPAGSVPADPLPAGSVPAGDAPTGRRWPAVRRPHLIAALAALVVLGTVFTVTALPVSHRWLHNRSIWYADHLRAEVALRDRAGPWSMYTVYAPQTVSPYAWGRYSLAPNIAELLTGHPVSADDLAKPMYVVDADGHLRPARFRAMASVPPACSTGQERIMQPLSRPLPKGVWNVQLSYRVSRPTTLRFAIDPGTGVPVEATGAFRGFPVTGSGKLTFLMRQSAVTAFRLDAAVAGACISDVQIGQPVPA